MTAYEAFTKSVELTRSTGELWVVIRTEAGYDVARKKDVG